MLFLFLRFWSTSDSATCSACTVTQGLWLGLDRYQYSVSVSGRYQWYRSGIGILKPILYRYCSAAVCWLFTRSRKWSNVVGVLKARQICISPCTLKWPCQYIPLPWPSDVTADVYGDVNVRHAVIWVGRFDCSSTTESRWKQLFVDLCLPCYVIVWRSTANLLRIHALRQCHRGRGGAPPAAQRARRNRRHAALISRMRAKRNASHCWR